MLMLVRIQVPDRPGSLGRVAVTIAKLGADIVSVKVVDRSQHGTVIDDFIVDLPQGVLADSLISAFDREAGVKVLWISRAQHQWDKVSEANLIAHMVTHVDEAREALFEFGPHIFHCHWAIITHADDLTRSIGTELAPEPTPQRLAALGDLSTVHAMDLPQDWAPGWGEVVAAVVPNARGVVMIMGRQGGPAFLDAELVKLARVAQFLP